MKAMETETYTYRYETHCHTNWCSRCAHNEPEEMARAYWEKGYAGMVITDHFLLGNSAVDKSLPWEDKVRRYYAAYEAAKRWGDQHDFHVLFGLEHQYGAGKEVLTYGVDLPFLLAHPDLHLYPLDGFVRAVHQAGGVVSMAHPYRHAGYIDPKVLPRPECLDGAEVYNAFNTPEENRDALDLARKNGLFFTSGGDVHSIREKELGTAGIALNAPIREGRELVQVLKSRDYRLIVNGKVAAIN